jgi:hypothetical protein
MNIPMRLFTSVLPVLVCAAFTLAARPLAAQSETSNKLAYPSSVPVAEGISSVWLTKDASDAVRKFYQKKISKQTFPDFLSALVRDTVEQIGQTGRLFGFTYLIPDGSDTSRVEDLVEVWSFDPHAYKAFVDTINEASRAALDPAATPPFLYLMNEVRAERHTQQEFDALVKQYGHVLHAYYREVASPEGKSVSEAERIIRAHYERVYGRQGMTEQEKQGVDEKKMKAVQAKMKRLKKEGKTAEMMELAMQMQKEMNATPAGKRVKEMQEGQMKAMTTDNWKEWVECLKEMETAGYRTKIVVK